MLENHQQSFLVQVTKSLDKQVINHKFLQKYMQHLQKSKQQHLIKSLTTIVDYVMHNAKIIQKQSFKYFFVRVFQRIMYDDQFYAYCSAIFLNIKIESLESLKNLLNFIKSIQLNLNCQLAFFFNFQIKNDQIKNFQIASIKSTLLQLNKSKNHHEINKLVLHRMLQWLLKNQMVYVQCKYEFYKLIQNKKIKQYKLFLQKLNEINNNHNISQQQTHQKFKIIENTSKESQFLESLLLFSEKIARKIIKSNTLKVQAYYQSINKYYSTKKQLPTNQSDLDILLDMKQYFVQYCKNYQTIRSMECSVSDYLTNIYKKKIPSDIIFRFIQQNHFNSQQIFSIFFQFLKNTDLCQNRLQTFYDITYTKWNNKSMQSKFIAKLLQLQDVNSYCFVQKHKYSYRDKKITTPKDIWKLVDLISLAMDLVQFNKEQIEFIFRQAMIHYPLELQNVLNQMNNNNKTVFHQWIVSQFIKLKLERVFNNNKILKLLYTHYSETFQKVILVMFEQNRNNVIYHQNIVYQKLNKLEYHNIEIKKQILKKPEYQQLAVRIMVFDYQNQISEIVEWLKQKIEAERQQFITLLIQYIFQEITKINSKEELGIYDCHSCHQNKLKILKFFIQTLFLVLKNQTIPIQYPLKKFFIKSIKTICQLHSNFYNLLSELHSSYYINTILFKTLLNRIEISLTIKQMIAWRNSMIQSENKKYIWMKATILFELITNIKHLDNNVLRVLYGLLSSMHDQNLFNQQQIDLISRIILTNLQKGEQLDHFCIKLLRKLKKQLRQNNEFCKQLPQKINVLNKYPEILHYFYLKPIQQEYQQNSHQLIVINTNPFIIFSKNCIIDQFTINYNSLNYIVQQKASNFLSQIVQNFDERIIAKMKQLIYFYQNPMVYFILMQILQNNNMVISNLKLYLYGKLIEQLQNDRFSRILYDTLNFWFQIQSSNDYNDQNLNFFKNSALLLGQITLKKNKPILLWRLNIKQILIRSKIEKHRFHQNIIIILKLLHSLKYKSVVYTVKNPWLATILNQLTLVMKSTDNQLVKFQIQNFYKSIQYLEPFTKEIPTATIKFTDSKSVFGFIISKEDVQLMGISNIDVTLKSLFHIMNNNAQMIGDLMFWLVQNIYQKIKTNFLDKHHFVINNTDAQQKTLQNYLLKLILPIITISLQKSQLYLKLQNQLILELNKTQSSLPDTHHLRSIVEKIANQNLVVIFSKISQQAVKKLSQINKLIMKKLQPKQNQPPKPTIDTVLNYECEFTDSKLVTLSSNNIYNFKQQFMLSKYHQNLNKIMQQLSEGQKPDYIILQINNSLIEYNKLNQKIIQYIIEKNLVGGDSLLYFTKIASYLSEYTSSKQLYAYFLKIIPSYERKYKIFVQKFSQVGYFPEYSYEDYENKYWSEYEDWTFKNQVIRILSNIKLKNNNLQTVFQYRNYTLKFFFTLFQFLFQEVMPSEITKSAYFERTIKQIIILIKFVAEHLEFEIIINSLENFVHYFYFSQVIKQKYLAFFNRFIILIKSQIEILDEKNKYVLRMFVIKILERFTPIRYQKFLYYWIDWIRQKQFMFIVSKKQDEPIYLKILQSLFIYLQTVPSKILQVGEKVSSLIEILLITYFESIKQNELKWMCWLTSNNKILNQQRIKILEIISSKQKYPLTTSVKKIFDMSDLMNKNKNLKKNTLKKKDIEKFKDFFLRKSQISTKIYIVNYILECTTDESSHIHKDYEDQKICFLINIINSFENMKMKHKIIRILFQLICSPNQISFFILKLIAIIKKQSSKVRISILQSCITSFSKINCWASSVLEFLNQNDV